MTSGCLDRKEVRGAIWGVHSTTDRPAGGNTGRLFLAFGGPVCADRISNCPLDRVLTYKNLIYLLNLQFCHHVYYLQGCCCTSYYMKNLIRVLLTPQPIRAVGVFFSPMVSGWAGGHPGGWAGGGKKFVWAISQKL